MMRLSKSRSKAADDHLATRPPPCGPHRGSAVTAAVPICLPPPQPFPPSIVVDLPIDGRHCMPARSAYARLDDLVSWLAASVLVTAGVIYALRDRRRPAPAAYIPPRATPAQEPRTLQERRAAEPSRGRQAGTPAHIPWRGWKDVLVRTYYEIHSDRLMALAGSVAFYSLLALFPAIAAAVSSYALFADAGAITKHLSIASDIIPAGALDLLNTEIARIAAKSDGRLTVGFLVGLGVALWSANAGMKSIFD